MLSEEKVTEMFKSISKFLTEQDRRKKPQDIEVYEHAVREYCLLHDILEIKTPRKWDY
jgi:hypothetical protein